MHATDPQSWIIVAGVVVPASIALAAWRSYQKKRSHRLQQRFGPEYERTVEQLGSRSRGEAELKAREKRVGRLNIVPLAASEAVRFREAWRALERGFVDNPTDVFVRADRLVRELMQRRGYPMGEFVRRASDIAVDHPAVVDNFRAAQAIAVRDGRGEADAEDLRKAMVHYRALFEDLLDVTTSRQVAMPAKRMGAQSSTLRRS